MRKKQPIWYSGSLWPTDKIKIKINKIQSKWPPNDQRGPAICFVFLIFNRNAKIRNISRHVKEQIKLHIGILHVFVSL